MSDPITEQLSSKNSVTCYVYQVPAKLAKETGIHSVGVKLLTAKDELSAAKSAGRDAEKMGQLLALYSLAEVNGKPVSVGDGSADMAFNDMHPKVRTLVMQAYGKLHAPDDQESEDFLGSQQLKVEG